MVLGNQGKGSRFADEKDKDITKTVRVESDNKNKPKATSVHFTLDEDTLKRLNLYVFEEKVIKGDKSKNCSYVARQAISDFLKLKGF